MKKQFFFLFALLLLLSSIALGAGDDSLKVDFSKINYTLGDYPQLGPGGSNQLASCERITEINNDNIREFCFQVQGSIIWVLVVAMLLWITEPAVRKHLSEVKSDSRFLEFMLDEGGIPFIMKWIGLGLIFMAIYSLKVMM